MILILKRLFIKETDNANAYRKAMGTLCSSFGIFLNIMLFVGKFFAGFISGSIAIMADAFNNLSDAGASIMSLIGFWYAGKEADTDHPFGHGRFEYLSGLGVAVIIVLMGFELAKGSVEKIINPANIDSSAIVIGILIVSILVKLYMAMYNRKIGKEINSSAMQATSVDSISDVGATSFVLIATLVIRFFGVNIDGICGLIVSVVIIYAGYSVLKETISPLLGQQPEQEFVDNIYEIVMSHEMIKGIHDLLVHDYGPGRLIISLHTEVPGDENIYEIHDLIDQIEKELQEKLGCLATIHMDPIETNNEMVKELKRQIELSVKSINDKLSIHDFRMVSGNTHTNLIFDVVVPFDIDETKESIKDKITRCVKEQIGEKFNCVIHIDRGIDYRK